MHIMTQCHTAYGVGHAAELRGILQLTSADMDLTAASAFVPGPVQALHSIALAPVHSCADTYPACACRWLHSIPVAARCETLSALACRQPHPQAPEWLGVLWGRALEHGNPQVHLLVPQSCCMRA